jgi:hypothetical protein
VKKDKKQLRIVTKEEHRCNTAIEIKNKIEGRRKKRERERRKRRRNGNDREQTEEQVGRRRRGSRQRGE